MIIIAKLKDGHIVKLYIKNQVFYTIDQVGQKLDPMVEGDIKAIIWFDANRKMVEMKTSDWVKIAEANDYWQS